MSTMMIVLVGSLALIGAGGLGVVGWGFYQETLAAGRGILTIVIGGGITALGGIAMPIANRILNALGKIT